MKSDRKSADTPRGTAPIIWTEAKIAAMSATKGIRQLPRKEATTPLYCEVSERLKAIVDRTSAATGLSKTKVVEEILARVPLDDRGVAAWADEWVQRQGLDARPLPFQESLSA